MAEKITTAGKASAEGVSRTGDANAKSLSLVGQGIVTSMVQIANVIAQSNTRGGFFSGLLMAAASGAVSGLTGALFNGSGGGGGSKGDAGMSGTGGKAFADGGLLTGRGSGTSDNIAAIDRASGRQTAWVSPGEFVINAMATMRNRALLEFINAGGDAERAIARRASGGPLDSYVPPIFVGASSVSGSTRTFHNSFHVTIQGGTGTDDQRRRSAGQIARESARLLQSHLDN
jgi:hypothetical protein